MLGWLQVRLSLQESEYNNDPSLNDLVFNRPERGETGDSAKKLGGVRGMLCVQCGSRLGERSFAQQIRIWRVVYRSEQTGYLGAVFNDERV